MQLCRHHLLNQNLRENLWSKLLTMYSGWVLLFQIWHLFFYGQDNWSLKTSIWYVLMPRSGQEGRRWGEHLESPLDCKEIQSVHSKGDQPWDFFGRTDAKAETPVLWPPHVKNWLSGKDWCWAGLGAGGEGDDRGWDGWMASPTGWTWVWVNSGSWWWTERPGVLRFMGSQRVGHDWATELNWDQPLNTLYKDM